MLALSSVEKIWNVAGIAPITSGSLVFVNTFGIETLSHRVPAFPMLCLYATASFTSKRLTVASAHHRRGRGEIGWKSVCWRKALTARPQPAAFPCPALGLLASTVLHLCLLKPI